MRGRVRNEGPPSWFPPLTSGDDVRPVLPVSSPLGSPSEPVVTNTEAGGQDPGHPEPRLDDQGADVAGPPTGQPSGHARPAVERVGPSPVPRTAEPSLAAGVQVATMFALDYLSYDEDDPAQRWRALTSYLPPGADGGLGWDGHGRQRAEIAVAGTTTVVDDLLRVDMRVRVVPYLRADGHPRHRQPYPASSITPRAQGRQPSSAPAPVALGWWVAAPAIWVQLWVPVRQDRRVPGGVVIDPSQINSRQ